MQCGLTWTQQVAKCPEGEDSYKIRHLQKRNDEHLAQKNETEGFTTIKQHKITIKLLFLTLFLKNLAQKLSAAWVTEPQTTLVQS